MEQVNLKKGNTVFYVRDFHSQEIHDVLKLTLRTVTDTYFVGIEEKEQHALLFSYSDIGKTVFLTFGEALEYL